MAFFNAEQLIFVDESSFNRQTGWRRYAYAPIGEEARYEASRSRGSSYSLLPAYGSEGYVCYTIKEGFFNREHFLHFIDTQLLPLMRPWPNEKSVIVMDNASIHVSEEVYALTDPRGVKVLFLPPYSPQYNPIELTFSVLKCWIRRHFGRLFGAFHGDFEGFLRFAIQHSRCDSHAKKHFKHAPHGGYVFDADLNAYEEEPHAAEEEWLETDDHVLGDARTWQERMREGE